MKLAGPPAMMDVLLLTKRPAPMMPPIEIMVRWRGFKERESSFFPVASAGFDTVISGTSVGPTGHLTLLLRRHAARPVRGPSGRRLLFRMEQMGLTRKDLEPLIGT